MSGNMIVTGQINNNSPFMLTLSSSSLQWGEWNSGPPATITNLPNRDAPPDPTSGQTHSVNVVQGTGPRGLLVTLYFDTQTGLLLRELRYGNSPIGRVPTMIEYGDYRDVDGIKFPFRITYAWLDGRDTIMLSEIKTNVPVDEAKFGRPAPVKR